MSTTIESPDQVARTIRQQIGMWSLARVGARDFAYSEDSLHFTVTGPSRRRVRIIVSLTPADTYTVKWFPESMRSRQEPQITTDVYCDMLSDIVEDIAAGNTAGWLQ